MERFLVSLLITFVFKITHSVVLRIKRKNAALIILIRYLIFFEQQISWCTFIYSAGVSIISYNIPIRLQTPVSDLTDSSLMFFFLSSFQSLVYVIQMHKVHFLALGRET